MSSSAIDGELGALARQPENLNFLTGGKFHMNFLRLPETTYFCESVTIPGLQTSPAWQATPFVDIPIGGDKPRFEFFEMEFKVQEDLKNYNELYDWIVGLTFPESREDQYKPLAQGGLDVRPRFGRLASDATLHILTNSSNYNFNVDFTDMFPLTISSINLRNDDEDIQPITATATFAYTVFDIKQVT